MVLGYYGVGHLQVKGCGNLDVFAVSGNHGHLAARLLYPRSIVGAGRSVWWLLCLLELLIIEG